LISISRLREVSASASSESMRTCRLRRRRSRARRRIGFRLVSRAMRCRMSTGSYAGALYGWPGWVFASACWGLRFRRLSMQRVPVDPRLSPEEREQVLAWLDESETAFLKAIDDVSAAQWKWKASPEQWSIGETAEHIVIAEAFL